MTSKRWWGGTFRVDILKILFQTCRVLVLNDTKQTHRRIRYGKIYLAVDINAFVYSVASLVEHAHHYHHPLPMDNPEIIDVGPALLSATWLPSSVVRRFLRQPLNYNTNPRPSVFFPMFIILWVRLLFLTKSSLILLDV